MIIKYNNIDDQKKPARTIRYLEDTKHLLLIFSMNTNSISEWWVDAAFAVYTDMKSRTGAVMSLSKCAICSVSTKQKVMTSSSTKAVLVGGSDTLPNITAGPKK